MSEDTISPEDSLESPPLPEQEAAPEEPQQPTPPPVPSRQPTRPWIPPKILNQLFGLAFIVLGALFLAGTIFNIRLGHLVWPFIFIVPGIFVFFLALRIEGTAGEPLTIVSSIFTMLGLIFLFQAVTGLWATWAYIWSLLAPTSIGLGEIIYGTQKGQQYTIHKGKTLVKIGLGIFLVGFVFFEMLIGISGFGLGRLGWPLLLIFLGLFLLFRNFSRGSRE